MTEALPVLAPVRPAWPSTVEIGGRADRLITPVTLRTSATSRKVTTPTSRARSGEAGEIESSFVILWRVLVRLGFLLAG